MGLEAASWIDDLIVTNPVVGDQVSEGDDHVRMLKTVLKACFPRAGKAFRFPTAETKSANYTAVSADQNKLLSVSASTAARIITLPTLVAGDAGWMLQVQKSEASVNTVSVVPAAGTIQGESSIILQFQYQIATLYWTGTVWLYWTSRQNIYENAAWTPAFTFATPGDLSVVYNAQAGFYIRIGGLVVAQFNLDITPTHTTASGGAAITGLPYAVIGTGAGADGSTILRKLSKISITGKMIGGRAVAGGSQIVLENINDAVATTVAAASQFVSGTTNIVIAGTCIYRASGS